MNSEQFARLRQNMVETQLMPRGITDQKVLEAFYNVPRHLFVNPELQPEAYNDGPLPIGRAQTISQPYIVALMTESLGLNGNEKILEIGTGSGYQTAILAEIAEHVYTIERFEHLSMKASSLLNSLGYENISYKVGDGSRGWPEEAPFDDILVTAAARRLPEPLLEQLANNSKMVIPVGDTKSQVILVISKDSRGNISKQETVGCRFVPLVEEEEK
jgi:protein-L-isoaspartate(D-aspartate) O-methyltransferase